MQPSAKSRSAVEWRVLRDLAPHLWPAGNLGIRLRVVLALTLLTGAKLATVYVPILFKQMVDLFSDPANLPIVLPLGLVVGYGALRVAAIAFSELRDAVFAKVAQRAIRTVALQTFRHLHGLSASISSGKRAACRESSNAAPPASTRS
jgi:ATP-binding cassette subfamily B protein